MTFLMSVSAETILGTKKNQNTKYLIYIDINLMVLFSYLMNQKKVFLYFVDVGSIFHAIKENVLKKEK